MSISSAQSQKDGPGAGLTLRCSSGAGTSGGGSSGADVHTTRVALHVVRLRRLTFMLHVSRFAREFFPRRCFACSRPWHSAIAGVEFQLDSTIPEGWTPPRTYSVTRDIAHVLRGAAAILLFESPLTDESQILTQMDC